MQSFEGARAPPIPERDFGTVARQVTARGIRSDGRISCTRTLLARARGPSPLQLSANAPPDGSPTLSFSHDVEAKRREHLPKTPGRDEVPAELLGTSGPVADAQVYDPCCTRQRGPWSVTKDGRLGTSASSPRLIGPRGICLASRRPANVAQLHAAARAIAVRLPTGAGSQRRLFGAEAPRRAHARHAPSRIERGGASRWTSRAFWPALGADLGSWAWVSRRAPLAPWSAGSCGWRLGAWSRRRVGRPCSCPRHGLEAWSPRRTEAHCDGVVRGRRPPEVKNRGSGIVCAQWAMTGTFFPLACHLPFSLALLSVRSCP